MKFQNNMTGKNNQSPWKQLDCPWKQLTRTERSRTPFRYGFDGVRARIHFSSQDPTVKNCNQICCGI